MPYCKVTWAVTVRAKDKAEAVEVADDERNVGDCTVAEVLQSQVPDVVTLHNPELLKAHWPSVTFVLADGDTWQGTGPLLDVLDNFLEAGLRLKDVSAIIPLRD